MKTYNSVYQPDIINNLQDIKDKVAVKVYENNLQLKAWVIEELELKSFYIYAVSPYISKDAHVILHNRELIIQAGIKVEVIKPYNVKKLGEDVYFTFNSVYSVIKSSTIYLPNDHKYNLSSYQVLDNGILLIYIKYWNPILDF